MTSLLFVRFTSDIIVCRVTSTAFANSSCVIFFLFSQFFYSIIQITTPLCIVCFTFLLYHYFIKSQVHFTFYLKKQATFSLSLVFALVIQFQYRHKRLLWYFYATDLTHTLFTLFLFFKKFLFTRNITAVTFCKHVLTHCSNSFTSDNL